MRLKVGELAKRSGVSVRTLHHYDEIGLLSPSQRTESGHRVYTDADVSCLQQIISLRSLGFSLEQIAKFLQSRPNSPLQIMDMHLAKLRQEAEERKRLIENLENITNILREGQHPSVDELLNLIEGMTMIEKYYDTEQLDKLKQRREMLGDEKIKQVEAEWGVLIAEVKTEMERGSDPASATMQDLAKRWVGLLELFTGGDQNIANSCRNMYQQEGPEKASRGMLDAEVFEYMGRAIALLGQKN